MTYPRSAYISKWNPLPADTTQRHTVMIEDMNGVWTVEEDADEIVCFASGETYTAGRRRHKIHHAGWRRIVIGSGVRGRQEPDE